MLNTQIARKCSLVMPVNRGNFGEWVKRQMNYQNKTKHRNKENQTTSHVHSKNSSVSPAGTIISSKQDLTEHMALQ